MHSKTDIERFRQGQVHTRTANTNFFIQSDKYEIIYVDSPWPYHGVQVKKDAASKHDLLMDLDDIQAMSNPSITTGDVVRFLWATSPKIKNAIATMEAWGFATIKLLLSGKRQIEKVNACQRLDQCKRLLRLGKLNSCWSVGLSQAARPRSEKYLPQMHQEQT
jgi:hypothetical protein